MSVTVTSYIYTVSNAVEKALMRAAEEIGGSAEGHAKELCPVDTGNLRNSISHSVENNFSNEMSDPGDIGEAGEITVIIGTNVEYAAYVELGHNQEPGRYVPAIGKRLVADHVAAKPFIRPAMENFVQEYKQIIETTVTI